MAKRILILCTGNSCRSQMAEGYLRHFAAAKAQVYSAGIETHGVNKIAIAVMQEDGVDISMHTSNNAGEYKHLHFDYVLTVCDSAREQCPLWITRVPQIHASFPDPAKVTGSPEEIINQFRVVRDAIKNYCRQFVLDFL